jgi:hypothetical protein
MYYGLFAWLGLPAAGIRLMMINNMHRKRDVRSIPCAPTGHPEIDIILGGRNKGISMILTAGVDAFHQAVLAAGACGNGAPRLRPDHHPNYYGAFVFDPDRYNIEAVCRKAQ